jgi:hypothetical protein
VSQALVTQELFDRLQRRGNHRIVVLARDLQRRSITKEVGQRQDQRQQQHHHDEDVFPARILKHFSMRSSACPWASAR